MWSLRRVVSKSANITPTAIAQNVVDLVLGETDRVVGVNAELGSLKGKVGQVTGVPAGVGIAVTTVINMLRSALRRREFVYQIKPPSYNI